MLLRRTSTLLIALAVLGLTAAPQAAATTGPPVVCHSHPAVADGREVCVWVGD